LAWQFFRALRLNLSSIFQKKVKAKICMEGRMIMTMMIACIEMVAVGVCGVCPAKSI